MPGPQPKDPNRRQRRNTGAVVPFRTAGVVIAPPLPPGFLVATRDLWQSFWKSPLGQAVEAKSDIGAIGRLFTLMDERERAYRAYRKQRVIHGSQGQKVISPMARAMSVFDAEIRQLEDRFGMTPRARLQLGIQFGEAAKSLAELNRMLEEDHQENEDTDPRE